MTCTDITHLHLRTIKNDQTITIQFIISLCLTLAYVKTEYPVSNKKLIDCCSRM
jgi:hypothetical protein